MKKLTHIHSKRHNHIRQVVQKSVKDKYAFRIGFLGDHIDRFDSALIGKVLEQKSFNTQQEMLSDDVSGTTDAAWLLSTSFTDLYSVDRHRIVAATLYRQSQQDMQWQFQQAIEWLRRKQVKLIFFQHNWMLAPEWQAVLKAPSDLCFSTVASG